MNKIALITGGSRGLGRSMALYLAERGVDIVFTYRAAAPEANQVVERIRGFGRKAVALPLDVTDSASFGRFAETVAGELERTFGAKRFDFLVNNAGVGAYGSLEQMTEEAFDELYRVHLKGTFFVTQKLLPMLADGGRILNTSSGLARFALPGYAAYAAMKGGVEVLTRYMARELGPRGIAVNTIAPGAIETDFGGGTVRDNRALNAQIASVTAMGRVGLPDDIGGAVAALLDEGAGWMTGQRIEVSGGQMI